MAISTLDGYLASVKQKVPWVKTVSRTSTATTWWSVYDIAGSPGAGTLAVGNTANGLVPADTTAGAPGLNAFTGGATGYLTSVEYGSSVAGRLMLYDRLFHAGAFVFNAAVTLATQPSYSARIPVVNAAADYTGTQIWYECVTAVTTSQSVAVTYTNQSGATGHTTGTVAFGLAPTLGRMIQLPLAAGDSGVSIIESVTSTGATVGTFNILVARPLWFGRVMIAGDGDLNSLDRTGMPIVFATSCLHVAICADSTATGAPNVFFEIANG